MDATMRHCHGFPPSDMRKPSADNVAFSDDLNAVCDRSAGGFSLKAASHAFVENFGTVSLSFFTAVEKTLNQYKKYNHVVFVSSFSSRSLGTVLRYEWVYCICSSVDRPHDMSSVLAKLRETERVLVRQSAGGHYSYIYFSRWQQIALF
ncbi:hypothetical protein CSKR_109520 [Clonorchis sinensis]|uniref:Uncharacterized protein n=1 Tax=Clonorchis sinensis TaxID=79923 RepID=A0A3R7GXG9_CLOSI|nr:hypothetical protein CSKR_109520 [Clonorchis sinensis]